MLRLSCMSTSPSVLPLRSQRKKRLDRALIAFALISASSLATAKTPQQQANGRAAISAADFAESVGGTLSTFHSPALIEPKKLLNNPTNPNVQAFSFRYTGTTTGFDEEFLIGLPDPAVSSPRQAAPVLILWHQWSSSRFDTWSRTHFFELATTRGWYVIAPTGAHEFHMGIEYGQRNTQELINFMAQFVSGLSGLPPFDETRIYGVGFSMGGGGLVSNACRYLDPTGFPYAAIFNLTGTMSAASGWLNDRLPPKNNPTQFGTELRSHPMMFGGDPGLPQFSFGYQIASTIHLWPTPNIVAPGSDLLRNIPEINVSNSYISGDTHPNKNQVDQAVAHATTAHAGSTSQFLFSELPPDPTVPPTQTAHPLHCWEHIHPYEDQILTWFEDKRFDKPSGYARILADRDARYYDISVTQNPSLVAASHQGIFSAFEYDVSDVMPANTLWLESSRETAALEIHSADMGLDTTPGALLTLDLNGPATPTPVQIILNDSIAAPSLVTRDGVTIPATSTGPNSWSFSGSKLTIHESNPSSTPTPTPWTIQ